MCGSNHIYASFPVPDPSWGAHGNGAAYLGFDLGGNNRDLAFVGLLRPDHRLLMTGVAPNDAGLQPAFGQVLATDGAPDPTFGNADGRATIPIESDAKDDGTDAIELSDGRVAYLGSADPSTLLTGRVLADE